MKRSWSYPIVASLVCLTGIGKAEEVILYHQLADYPVVGERVANETPATGVATAVSALRFDPLVDVQARGPAERQGDISIRGGIFENTGFNLGPIPLLDPQTGHYFGELPLDPNMLSRPQVLTGLANAREGLNSTVGTVRYDFTTIQRAGSAEAGVGSHGLNYQRVYQGWHWDEADEARWRVGADVSASRAEGHGTIEQGDFAYERLAGRLQVLGPAGQTDVFAGYSDEFYGWPGMYMGTAYGSLYPETDHYRLTLVGAVHRGTYGDRSFVEAGVAYRRLADTYQFNRTAPSEDFVHETEVWTSGLQGRHAWGDAWAVDYQLAAVRDHLVHSASLTGGDFDTREYVKAAVIPVWTLRTSQGDEWAFRGGLAMDTSNRDATRGLPQAGIVWTRHGHGSALRLHLEYATASQVPGYTALKSAPVGLFGGHPDLGRETSRNLETGIQFERENLSLQATVFRREDRALVDWIFSGDTPNARRAAPVDIDTFGAEVVAALDFGNWRWIAGYMWLDKEPDYGDQTVEASFYALNFAEHRLTLATIFRPVDALEIRVDTELRRQAGNSFREGSATAFRTTAGISWFVPTALDLELGARVDNITKSNFEPLPGTPGEGRQVSVFARVRW